MNSYGSNWNTPYQILIVTVLYCHLRIHAEIYIYMLDTYRRNNNWRNDKDAMINRRRKTSLTKYLPLTLLQGFEKVVWGFTVRGSWRPNITEIFWPRCYDRQRCVFLVFQGCSTGGPGLTLLGDLLHLISIFSGPQLIRASNGPFGLMWLSLAHLVYNSVQSPWNSNSTVLNSVLTELYNSSTPTWSLKSHV